MKKSIEQLKKEHPNACAFCEHLSLCGRDNYLTKCDLSKKVIPNQPFVNLVKPTWCKKS